ncbi:hypothetical protein PVA44_06790 (plasmid) [Entomospira nematocerorum]|uniref:Uncharacterized protein n=1 Tax=Entomospira nematocerorum TaxID=2719987 RepID=A0A968KYI9_9SPIO|nr:hypothetical protein [Entomospira nematocera]NIZ47612.1 hypothetical protein [Entomospira nematocera]WDI34616.1 hypothetical protein PVA44_06790 [Entomospira nematocera]
MPEPLSIPQREEIHFQLSGNTFTLPLAWLVSEDRTVSNQVQLSEQSHLLPVISSVHNQLTLQLEIPVVHVDQRYPTEQLKSYLLTYGQMWATLKHTLDGIQQGMGTKVPFTGISLPLSLPLITSYMGDQHYMLAGIIQQFRSTYSPKTLQEQWHVTLQGINMTQLRQGIPPITQALGRIASYNHATRTNRRWPIRTMVL